MYVSPEYARIIREHQKAAPVDVVALAKAMGVNVWQSTKLGPTISGKLFKDAKNGGSSGWSILSRSTEDRRRAD
jgi:hypothetical protein